MQDIDLEDLTLDELKDLRKRIAKAIASYEERRKKEAFDAVKKAARQFGFSLEQLAAVTPKKARTVRPTK